MWLTQISSTNRPRNNLTDFNSTGIQLSKNYLRGILARKHIKKCFPKQEKYSYTNNKTTTTSIPSNTFWDTPLLPAELCTSTESKRWNNMAATPGKVKWGHKLTHSRATGHRWVEQQKLFFLSILKTWSFEFKATLGHSAALWVQAVCSSLVD